MVARSLLLLLLVVVGAVFSVPGAGTYELIVHKSRKECDTSEFASGCPPTWDPVCAAGCRKLKLTTFQNICYARQYSADNSETLVVFKGRCPC